MGGSPLIEFLIDSGAEINVISELEWTKLKLDFDAGHSMLFDLTNKSSKRILAFAGKEALKIQATFKAWIDVPGSDKPNEFASFFVITGGAKSLLSKSTAIKLKLLKMGLSVNFVSTDTKSEEVKAFPSIPEVEAEFEIDESVTPTKNAYYHVPAAFSERAKQRLKDMEASDIIEKVTKAPRWISGMSAVKKGKDDFRLVVNMKGPNKAIRRSYHPLPLMKVIQRKLFKAQWFTKLDLTSAFYHIVIAENSRDITTFMTEDGMYRYKRLVFGVNCAPEIFQRTMEWVFSGIPGVINFIDDILIYGETLEQLRERSIKVLEVVKINNLTLNEAKCEYEKQTVTFLGHKLTAEGFNIEETKIDAISKFRAPTTTSELKSFLGLASYVSSYVPKFTDMTACLWKATKKDGFCWGLEQQTAFVNTKQAIMKCTVTRGYFGDKDKSILYTDASPYAIGAVLTQENETGEQRIISFASKALTETEQRYAQTQREALAIVWAVEHFYYFLMGRKFLIRTDAQGIMFIFQKGKEISRRALSRAEGWALRLSSYDFDIEFVPGKLNIADPSSRLYEGTDKEFKEKEQTGEISLISSLTEDITFSDESMPLREVQLETAEDEDLQNLRKALESDIWPWDLRNYETIKQDLSEQSGLITKNGAIVLPYTLRRKALALAHVGHPGMTAMKSILRSRVWWPSMNKQAELTVRQCVSCTLMAPKEPPSPMERRELPNDAWENLSIDYNGPYAQFGGISILVIVDAYSRYLIASPVKTTDFSSLRTVFDILFKRFGKPKSILSDNGPPMNGSEYEKYCRDEGIEKLHSTPLHPQQNGLAERNMQIINKAMTAASTTGLPYTKTLQNAVQAHNAAVHRVTGFPPEELMLKRKIRRSLPLFGNPQVVVDATALHERDETEKYKAKEREDHKRRAREPRMGVGDKVVVFKPTRAKGDAKYGSTPFEIISMYRGDCVIESPEGKNTKTEHIAFEKINARHLARSQRRSAGENYQCSRKGINPST